jgi:protoheme IX farnesyltransferase
MSDLVWRDAGRGGQISLADASGASAPGSAGSLVSDWLALMKPRVMTLVVFSGLVGMLVAPGRFNPVLAGTSILCIAVGAGAAGAINMWYDRDIDAIMRRTARRPLPAGRIAPGGALGFGMILAIASVCLLWLATNLAAALMLAGSIAFYVFIYTAWLKRRTPQNIVIGGAAGAFPPLIGWMAVTGSAATYPLLMFAIIFLWTPPHFWSLALWAHADYERAGVPMLPVVSGGRETRRQILLYTFALVPVSLLPWVLGEAGPVYGFAAAALGIGFIGSVWRVLRDEQDASGRSLTADAPAKRAFRYSILYLFVLFGAMAVDHWVG